MSNVGFISSYLSHTARSQIFFFQVLRKEKELWAGQEAKISQFYQDLEIIFLIKLFALQQRVECSSSPNTATETPPLSPNLTAWGTAEGMNPKSLG